MATNDKDVGTTTGTSTSDGSTSSTSTSAAGVSGENPPSDTQTVVNPVVSVREQAEMEAARTGVTWADLKQDSENAKAKGKGKGRGKKAKDA